MGGLRAVELFAGVGGFRLALQQAGHHVVWSNQWEPGKKQQWASDCYVRQFGPEGHTNRDIATVVASEIPDHDLLVGGFPCQDYSVAATLDKSRGIEGKKGVLWWEIERIVRAKRPSYLLLENVDRLLKSPARQRGRDFGILLSSLANLGYAVEWRVANAADYGFPQKRRRAFIYAAHECTFAAASMAEGCTKTDFLTRRGFFASCLPVREEALALLEDREADVVLGRSLAKMTEAFRFEFQNAGVMVRHRVWTKRVEAQKAPVVPLKAVLEDGVDERFVVPAETLPRWRYLKGAKREERVAKNGHRYQYAEGAIPFPDHVDHPSRTLLTGEGGTNPSRSNHILPYGSRFRVLTPRECERLNGFPDDWTQGMPDRWRYFTMGNALVVGLVARMAHHLPKPARREEAVAVAEGPGVRQKRLRQRV
ncbi:MAG TPA: DNA (cytosine-5-)-methyltransferase [Candidatus Thermoplasmatota archaeon]|nr:DNA (cytosine-5-)-methyltransferase [Candidatus Thermoplasmatota archaeon]